MDATLNFPHVRTSPWLYQSAYSSISKPLKFLSLNIPTLGFKNVYNPFPSSSSPNITSLGDRNVVENLDKVSGVKNSYGGYGYYNDKISDLQRKIENNNELYISGLKSSFSLAK